MRVLHVITGLGVGGAELMLKRLIASDPGSIDETLVVSLMAVGPVGEALRKSGVRVIALGMSSALDGPPALWRLAGIVRAFRPAVVQTWMYHADLWGGLAARLTATAPVVWNLRATEIPSGPGTVTFWLVRLCGILSRLIPARIIACSASAAAEHARLCYDAARITVIPNGYDFSALEFSPDSRRTIRREMGLDDATTLVGAVGRFDPMKDFRNFVSAAARVATARDDVHFVMVGRGNEWTNEALRGWILAEGLEARFHLVGEQADVPRFLSAMDVFCLSSWGEGFPNVLVEAMAVGLPCVATRAGAAAEILADGGRLVPVRDPGALGAALLDLCGMDPSSRATLGQRNAGSVRGRYAIERVRNEYQAVHAAVLKA